MKIAVIGSGISGLVSAWVLRREHEITLFEAADRIGGHTWTIDVELDSRRHAVDTGFVVFNESTYPNFIRFLDRLGIDSQPTSMSFSVRCETSGLEYCGTSLNTLFAQRRNLFRPSFHRLLREIVRFNRLAAETLAAGGSQKRLGDFLETQGFHAAFRKYYILPMAAAIWSSTPQQILDFPVDFLFRFLANHRLLTTDDHHPWRTIRGGSREYVRAATAPFIDRIRTGSPIRRLTRRENGVDVETGERLERFDRVVVATHSDQALRLIASPSPRETEILGAIAYARNDALLHLDDRLLPQTPLARASWNFTVDRDPRPRPSVTYDMTRLQKLRAERPICVSLNQADRVREERVLRAMSFEHPVFDSRAVAAQERHSEIDGADRIHFCGAYWGNGFHEDGVVSALAVCSRFGLSL